MKTVLYIFLPNVLFLCIFLLTFYHHSCELSGVNELLSRLSKWVTDVPSLRCAELYSIPKSESGLVSLNHNITTCWFATIPHSYILCP